MQIRNGEGEGGRKETNEKLLFLIINRWECADVGETSSIPPYKIRFEHFPADLRRILLRLRIGVLINALRL